MQFLELTMRGVLSFGPDTPPFPLRPLNVLIGPNGSGKSNLIEVIGLLRATTNKSPASHLGDVRDLFFKSERLPYFGIGFVVKHRVGRVWGQFNMRHFISYKIRKSRLEVDSELIDRPDTAKTEDQLGVFYVTEPSPRIRASVGDTSEMRFISDEFSNESSVLSQIFDPIHYPQLTYLSSTYSKIRIYREWTFGRNSIFRTPQPADMPHDRLEEDFSNLGLFLNHLRSKPKVKNEIISHLRDLYEGLDDFDVRVVGGTVELFLTEGDFVIPAGRLSDGTLRYLCLLAILCDPSPPPLVCIEEPELGLHPDLLPKVADLLVAASARTQLVVTTHSDILVDALSEHPESVVVFEKHNGKTEFRRLEANEELKGWLSKYRLGQLWSRGQLGGNRW